MDTMDIKTREGLIGELRVEADFLEQGYMTSKPATASCTYDLLVQYKGGDIKKVQIKSITPEENGIIVLPLRNRKNSSVAKNGRGQTHNYVELGDFISVYNKRTKDIYHVPTSVLPLDKITYRFKTNEHTGRSKAPSIEQYKL